MAQHVYIFVSTVSANQWYSLHLENHEQLLAQLDSALKRHSEFEHAYTEFESQKVCYLPLGTFLLKPIQRLIHYQQLLESKF
jgi:FERM/RhoGEF/pleckstrin domain protein 2